MTRRLALFAGSLLLVVCTAVDCSSRAKTGPAELQRAPSADFDVVLLSEREAIVHGTDDFLIEFQAKAGGGLVDVGTVAVTASLPKPGMETFAKVDVKGTDTPGRYAATGQFESAGSWNLSVKWLGPRAGAGSVSFSLSVR